MNIKSAVWAYAWAGMITAFAYLWHAAYNVGAIVDCHSRFPYCVVFTAVNFINIICTRFSYESASRSFSLVKFWLWQKDLGKKTTFVQKTGA